MRQRGALIIATDPNYRPQSFEQPDGTWTGFDVDVGREIARRLGVKPVFRAVNFNLIVRGNWLDKWDVDIGSMAVTHERTKVLWFSKPYYRVPGLVAVRKASGITSLADLKSKRIGVTAATTFESYLRGKLTGKVSVVRLHLEIVPYDTDHHALQDLATGGGRRIYAVLTSLPTINSAIAEGLSIRDIEPAVYEDRPAIALDRAGFHEPLGLLFAIDAAIDGMRRDGTLKKLSIKYYGVDLSDG